MISPPLWGKHNFLSPTDHPERKRRPLLLLLRGGSPQPQWDEGFFDSARVLRARPSTCWFLALLAWFNWAVQSVASAHRRLTRWNSTSFKSPGGKFAASFATCCLSHSRVLNLKTPNQRATPRDRVWTGTPSCCRGSAEASRHPVTFC